MNWKQKDFIEVYNEYYPLVLSTVYNKIKHVEDARDIAQDIFVSCYNNLEEIEDNRKWLFGAIRYRMIAYYKKKQKNVDVDIDEIMYDSGIVFVNGFKDTRIIIKEAIENPDNYENERERMIFDLVAIQLVTFEQAGKQLGMTKRQIQYYYEKIIARIKHHLKKKGIKQIEDLL